MYAYILLQIIKTTAINDQNISGRNVEAVAGTVDRNRMMMNHYLAMIQ